MSRKFHILLLLNLTRDENRIELPLLDPHRFYNDTTYIVSTSYNWPTSISYMCVDIVISLSPVTQHTQDQESRPFHVGLLNIIRGTSAISGGDVLHNFPNFQYYSELIDTGTCW